MSNCYRVGIRCLTENVTQNRRHSRGQIQAVWRLSWDAAPAIRGRQQEGTGRHIGRIGQDQRVPPQARQRPAVRATAAPPGADPAPAGAGAGEPPARGYTNEDKRAVLKLAAWFDEINSKRLRAAMDNTLSDLRRQGHLRVSADSYRRLGRISASTIGRIRHAVRLPGSRRKGFTKPGTLLKRQIPIRTFSAWDDTRAGFVEVDLVDPGPRVPGDHSGGDSKGDFAQTLNVTDVHTAWTEMRAVPTKAQRFVFAALQTIRACLPVPLLGIDSDNGAEFINNQLYRYCQTEQPALAG